MYPQYLKLMNLAKYTVSRKTELQKFCLHFNPSFATLFPLETLAVVYWLIQRVSLYIFSATHIDCMERSSRICLKQCWSVNVTIVCLSHLVGSSKNMTGGLLTSSRAIASRLHWPPDSELVRVWAHSRSPNAVRISCTWTEKVKQREWD